MLGVARGKGRVRFGGKKGRIFTLKAGDVGHPAGRHGPPVPVRGRRLSRRWRLPADRYVRRVHDVEDRPRALKTIPKVPPPRKDPVYGTGGPLPKLWKKAK